MHHTIQPLHYDDLPNIVLLHLCCCIWHQDFLDTLTQPSSITQVKVLLHSFPVSLSNFRNYYTLFQHCCSTGL